MRARFYVSTFLAIAILLAAAPPAEAAKVIGVSVLDKDYLVVQISDG